MECPKLKINMDNFSPVILLAESSGSVWVHKDGEVKSIPESSADNIEKYSPRTLGRMRAKAGISPTNLPSDIVSTPTVTLSNKDGQGRTGAIIGTYNERDLSQGEQVYIIHIGGANTGEWEYTTVSKSEFDEDWIKCTSVTAGHILESGKTEEEPPVF
jgi:hypothetical protein